MEDLLEKLLDRVILDEDVENAMLLIIKGLVERNQVSSQELDMISNGVIEAINDLRLMSGEASPDLTIH